MPGPRSCSPLDFGFGDRVALHLPVPWSGIHGAMTAHGALAVLAVLGGPEFPRRRAVALRTSPRCSCSPRSRWRWICAGSLLAPAGFLCAGAHLAVDKPRAAQMVLADHAVMPSGPTVSLEAVDQHRDAWDQGSEPRAGRSPPAADFGHQHAQCVGASPWCRAMMRHSPVARCCAWGRGPG